jgi:hypothetical protein
MKYQVSEDQYRKIILNYLNSVASDFVFEDDEYEDDNWVDILIGDDDNFGSLWFKTIENRGMITEGCYEELSLDEDFIHEFEQTIPIIMPKVFSEVVLEYFNSKTELECDCLEVPYRNGDKVYRYDSKEQ